MILQKRANETGRVVPKDLLCSVIEQVPKSVERLAPQVDFVVEIDNASDDELQLTTEGMSWEHFKDIWMQFHTAA